MKHLSTLLLAVGLSGFCAMAQNVTVVMKDGTSHKFNADHLSEITFRDVAPETPPVEFKTLTVEPYGGGNVTLSFADEAGTTVAKTDLYGPADATWLHAGTYTYNTANDPFTIDPAYSALTVAGESKTFTDATLVVTEAERVYSFDLEMTLEDGSKFRGSYSGQLDTYIPWIEGVELSEASYNENPQPAGDFYVKLNDADWRYSMAFVFTADPAELTLPAGTYTYSEIRMPGTISPASYFDTYNPSASLRLAAGSKVVVTRDGDSYDMVMTLNLSDGRTASLHYAGEIKGTPVFIQPEPSDFDKVFLNIYGSGNTGVELSKEDPEVKLTLDCYGSSSAKYFEAGEYVVGATEGFRIDVNPSYSKLEQNGSSLGVTGGKLTVTNEGAVYTLDADVTLSDGSEFKGRYVGELDTHFSVEFNKVLSAAKYDDNERPAGNMYVKFNDADWKTEMALDMFADKSATTLPAGTYTYSTEGTPGTFGPLSYVDLYYPSSNNRMKEGSTVEVALDGETYTITMKLLFEDGRTANMIYNGEIAGEPVFKSDVIMMTAVSETVYGYGNVELTFSNDTEEIKLDMYGNETAKFLEPGVYTVGREGFHIDAGYSGYTADGNNVNILSGTVTVAEADGVYTIDIDLMVQGASDGAEPRQIIRRYIGKLPVYGTLIERTMTVAEYNDYASAPGKIYVKFRNSDWDAVALNMFVPADAKVLPAGTYTYSADNAEFTFDGQSYAEISLGYGEASNRFVEGSTVTVEESEGVYDVKMNLIFTNGKKAVITFNGTIEGDPFPQQ